MNNKGYLTASDNNELYTPFYAVDPILKYIPRDKKIWCPFDKQWSAYVQRFKSCGYYVTNSHLDFGQDFFTYEPEDYDIIVSNPPFSNKDMILERLYSLNKPFAVLLPMNSLQGQSRFKYFNQGIQLLCFDKRIGYHNPQDYISPVEGSPFATAYFCRGVLPKDLIVEELVKYDRILKHDWVLQDNMWNIH